MKIDILIFSVFDSQYAMHSDTIDSIKEPMELSGTPNCHPAIDGMFSLNGQILKAMNFRKLINPSRYEEELNSTKTKLSKLIIYQDDGTNKDFAIIVDKIIDIKTIDTSEIKSTDDDTTSNSDFDSDGIIEIDDVLISIIKNIKLPKL